jgi:hypothetical protein
LKRAACNFGFTSYNKDYVDTLPQHIRIELNAIVAGNSNGIDMPLIHMMRNGIALASIESTCHANLLVAYSNWKNCYKHCCKKKADLGMNCVMADFPPFPSECVVKGPQLIKAFIRDYLSE